MKLMHSFQLGVVHWVCYPANGAEMKMNTVDAVHLPLLGVPTTAYGIVPKICLRLCYMPFNL